MKVALLLSGLPRKVKEGYNQYFKHIIDNYNTDVYLHYWEDREYNEVLKYYNPKKYICEPPKYFGDDIKGIDTLHDKKTRPDLRFGVAGNYYMYLIVWGWQQSFNLIERDYDCIVKSRYDIGWKTPIDLRKLDLTKLNISNMHWSNSLIPDDNLLITNHEMAKQLYGGIYDFWKYIAKERGYIEFPEKNLKYLLEQKGMYNYICKSPYLLFNLLRENKIWY